MRGPGKTKGRLCVEAKTPGKRIWRCWLLGISALPFITSGLHAQAEASPEQPEWNSSAIEPASDRTPSPAPSVGTGVPVNAGIPASLAPPPTVTGSDVSSEYLPSAEGVHSPTTPAASLGVPNSENSFLPDFNSYGRPFFERDGLRFRVGPVNLRFELGTSVGYNDNIFGTEMNPVADIVATVSPLIRIGIGDFQGRAEDYFSLEYQPSYQYYLENPEENRVNQLLHIRGKVTFSRYATDFDLNYLQDNAPNATQSGRQSYQILSFAWSNVYYLGAKTFASAAVTVLNQNYESSQNYTTYTLAPQLGYAYSPKTTIFAGPYAGIAYIGDGATQSFQGATVGFQYDTLRKVTFGGSFGIQSRQFNGLQASGSQNFTTPILNFTVGWKPRETTALQLSLTRDVQISDLGQGLTYTNSAVGGTLTQGLMRNLSLTLNLSYQYLEYDANAISSPDGRIDQYASASPGLTYRFWHDQIDFNVYYQRQQRTSDINSGNYTVNIYGIRVGYKF